MQLRYNNYLTAIRKYKPFIAAVLLSAYAFIATPIQFWHHHNYAVNAKRSSSTNDKEKITFSKSSGKSVEGNCQICSHHYSTYYNDATTIFAAPLIFASIKEGFYYTSIPSTPLFNLPNKGPPALS